MSIEPGAGSGSAGTTTGRASRAWADGFKGVQGGATFNHSDPRFNRLVRVPSAPEGDKERV